MRTPDREQAIRSCHHAIELIRQSGAVPTPANYELFYIHASRANEALSRAVDRALAEHGALSAADMEKLYQTYLAPGSEAERLLKLGKELGGVIDEVGDVMHEAIGSTGDFGSSLGQLDSRMGDRSDPEQARTLLAALFQATKKMGRAGLEIRKRLAESGRQVEQLEKDLGSARTESLTDPLTGIANRNGFERALEQEIARATKTGQPFCLFMIDIDHFERFNETFGRRSGDAALKFVAGMLRSSVRDSDHIARYGDEQLAVILPDIDVETAVSVAERTRRSVMKKELIKRSTGESLGRITLSMGVARFNMEDGAQSLVERADGCLDAARRAGRNRVLSETSPPPNGADSGERAA